jgi:NAD-dependent deacetylase
MRQHVLWFDEYYDEHDTYQWPRVMDAARRMDMVLFVGTSFSVGVTAMFLESGLGMGRSVFSVDPAAAEASVRGMVQIREPAEILLPRVMQALTRA